MSAGDGVFTVPGCPWLSLATMPSFLVRMGRAALAPPRPYWRNLRRTAVDGRRMEHWKGVEDKLLATHPHSFTNSSSNQKPFGTDYLYYMQLHFRLLFAKNVLAMGT